MKKILLTLIICYTSTHSMDKINNVHNIVTLNPAKMAALKDGLNQMVESGKKLENWQQNKAVATYIAFQERFNNASQLKYTSVVDHSDREHVDTLYRKVKDTQNFFDAIDAALEQQTTESWNQFRKVMNVETMNIMKENGVQFQPSPSKDTHADFLKANHDISDDSAKWLFPGSVMLYLAEQLQDENSTSSNTTNNLK